MSRRPPLGGPLRGNFRRADLRRVGHGLFVPINDHGEPFQEFVRDLQAWLLVLPDNAAYTHLTAAALLGWQLPPGLPEQLPVFVAVDQDARRPRRPGLICSRLGRSGKPGTAHDLPVEPATEILLRAARDLGELDLLILVDSARRLGHVDDEAMERLLATTRPGVRPLRRAWEQSNAKAESAGETLLRAFHACLQVPVRTQERVLDGSGRLVAQVDLAVIGTNLVHEYDGPTTAAPASTRRTCVGSVPWVAPAGSGAGSRSTTW